MVTTDAPTQIQLPTDRPRGRDVAYRAGVEHREFPAAPLVSAAVDAPLAFASLLALVHRYTEAPRIALPGIVGDVTISGQQTLRETAEEIAGRLTPDEAGPGPVALCCGRSEYAAQADQRELLLVLRAEDGRLAASA